MLLSITSSAGAVLSGLLEKALSNLKIITVQRLQYQRRADRENTFHLIQSRCVVGCGSVKALRFCSWVLNHSTALHLNTHQTRFWSHSSLLDVPVSPSGVFKLSSGSGLRPAGSPKGRSLCSHLSRSSSSISPFFYAHK